MVLELPILTDGEVSLLDRVVGNIPYVQNQKRSYKMRLRPNLCKCIKLSLFFDVELDPFTDISGPDMPWAFIQNITVRTPRPEIFKDVSGRTLSLMNKFEFGTKEFSTFRINQPGRNQFHADLLIPFENHTGVWPEATILNMNEFTELFIDITWGDARDIWTPEGEVTIYEIRADIIPLEREKINLSDEVEPRRKMIDYSERYDIEPQEMEFLLPENTLIKTLGLFTYRRDFPYSPRTNLIRNIQVVDDDNRNVIRNYSGSVLQSDNKQYYHIEKDDPLYVEQFPGFESYIGCYIIEFDMVHDLSGCYNTSGLNFPKLIIQFDTGPSPNTVLEIFTRQITTPPALQT